MIVYWLGFGNICSSKDGIFLGLDFYFVYIKHLLLDFMLSKIFIYLVKLFVFRV